MTTRTSLFCPGWTAVVRSMMMGLIVQLQLEVDVGTAPVGLLLTSYKLEIFIRLLAVSATEEGDDFKAAFLNSSDK